MIFCVKENIIFIEVRLRNLMTYFLKGMLKSLIYTWWSLMYKF